MQMGRSQHLLLVSQRDEVVPYLFVCSFGWLVCLLVGWLVGSLWFTGEHFDSLLSAVGKVLPKRGAEAPLKVARHGLARLERARCGLALALQASDQRRCGRQSPLTTLCCAPLRQLSARGRLRMAVGGRNTTWGWRCPPFSQHRGSAEKCDASGFHRLPHGQPLREGVSISPAQLGVRLPAMRRSCALVVVVVVFDSISGQDGHVAQRALPESRLAGWLVGWLAGWFVGWLVGWFVRSFVGLLVGSLLASLAARRSIPPGEDDPSVQGARGPRLPKMLGLPGVPLKPPQTRA